MSTYHQGETVRATITSKVVLDGARGPAVETGDRDVPLLPLSAPGVTVARVMPAQDPRPGEIWSTADGGLWLAQKYWPDYDDDKDAAGINDEGWRVRMIPLDGGDYGYRPEEVHQQFGLVACLHRVPVCECKASTTFGEIVHTRSCPQWPACDCPVSVLVSDRHLLDCAQAGEKR
ncbi:hypothetical protein [Actinomadura sp. WMMA1423]|uniref:hypothetical protein n=1 Tax=Actinomadura sp. WMMA1423 TaxID=2591108 RepID=UPI0011471087|nr:hypothetical protein [Actinomadura sp. WMMA1423]